MDTILSKRIKSRSGYFTRFVTAPALMATLCLLLAPSMQRVSHAAGGSAYVRVNQIGYMNGEAKEAVLLATGSKHDASFAVIDVSTGKSVYNGVVGSNLGSWSNAFPNTYLIDFSPAQTSGSYIIQVSGSINAVSPTFRIDSGANLYTGLLSNAEFFYQTQRDGPDVNYNYLKRMPSHLTDEQA